MKTIKTRKTVVMFLVLAGVLALSSAAMAGDLTPPAAPGPTMKTLDEVEPRTPIHASDLPLTISQSGSYYLAETINFSDVDTTGITIEANDVTIDLNGFALIGAGKTVGVGGEGITTAGNYNRITILNGSITQWRGRGVYLLGSGCRLSGLKVEDNGVIGIRAGDNAIVSDCVSRNNDSYGIYTTDNAVVRNCSASGNGSYGIYVGSGSTVTGNAAYNNGSYGVSTGSGSTVTGNTVYNNASYGMYAGSGSTITGNTAYINGSRGISTSAYCTVTGNTIYNNGDDGLWAGSSSTVTGNMMASNGGYGIYVNSYGTITGNTVTYNDEYGIKAGSNSMVSDNVVRSNNASDTANYAGIYVYQNCLVKGNILTANKQNNIYVYSSGNVVEENMVNDCTGNGIRFRIGGSFYANNRAHNNGTDYLNGAAQTDGGGNVSF